MGKLAERLAYAINRKGLKQSVIADDLGINRGALNSYLNGRYEPRSNTITKLAEYLDVSPSWLAGFDVPMERESARVFKPSSWSFEIPFISQKLSAGPGQEWLPDEDMEIKTINLAEDLPKGVDPSTLICAEVQGDSMIGVNLLPGDIVIFSRGYISGEGIYVLALCGDVLVKRLEWNRLENKLSIISENDRYPVQIVEADNDNVMILGKVVKWIHFER